MIYFCLLSSSSSVDERPPPPLQPKTSFTSFRTQRSMLSEHSVGKDLRQEMEQAKQQLDILQLMIDRNEANVGELKGLKEEIEGDIIFIEALFIQNIKDALEQNYSVISFKYLALRLKYLVESDH